MSKPYTENKNYSNEHLNVGSDRRMQFYVFATLILLVSVLVSNKFGMDIVMFGSFIGFIISVILAFIYFIKDLLLKYN